MKRPFFEVVQAKAGEAGRINIYGVIGPWWDETNAKGFIRAFNALEKEHERINIHINGPGGSVWEGLPIFNAIKASKKEVHTYNDGIAFSMAAMILLAAKPGRVHAAKGSLMMIHNVSTWSYGNARKLRKDADTMDKYDDVLGGLIADRTGKALDVVQAEYMDYDDHYFTPDEAKAEGFIDVVEDYDAEDMPENVKEMSPEQVAAWYDERMEEPSQSFMAKVMDQVGAMIGLNKDQNPKNMFGNKFSKLTALAKVAAGDVTAEQVDAVNTEIAEAGIEGVTLALDSELATAEQNATDLVEAKKKVTDLEARATKDNATIEALKAEVAELKGKPAAETTTTKTDKDDVIPTGEKEEEVDNFRTSVDEEYEQIWGK
ncbi:MAG TPA: head maturation protease, ClpP-related [Parapedobacter sp.]|uniref:head maturation protease, ClpP-related n=1 Tax=Parapedobacter sp. TaxID=1958893 RepID=UPI002BFC68CF|nr:head maturation protease, ClpP-related [Parapedobacter sp.]HWK58724.1 head maturation protease, ClpP-related [Parapedobacter sp.]